MEHPHSCPVPGDRDTDYEVIYKKQNDLSTCGDNTIKQRLIFVICVTTFPGCRPFRAQLSSGSGQLWMC